MAVNAQTPVAEREAALNTLLRAPGLEAGVLDTLLAGIYRETDVSVATGLLQVAARHGAGDLTEAAWVWLRQAPVAQAVRLVDALQTMGASDWVDAAHEVLARITDDEHAQSLLFKLQREGALTRQAIGLCFTSGWGLSTALYVNASLPEPVEVAVAYLTHPNRQVRRAAVEYLPAAEVAARVPLILELLPQEAEEYVRQGWVLTLGRHGDEPARSALGGLLRTDPSPTVRSAVLRAIQATPRAADLPALVDLTRGEDTVLRLEAARALGELGDPRARPVLEALLGQHERPMRESFGYAQTIAETAASALRALPDTSPTRSMLSAVWKALRPSRSED